MASPARPLRSGTNDEEGIQAPEALLISAFLEIGEFDPDRYHVVDDDIEAWKKLWVFCREYQATAGIAPPMSLVRQRFPDFTLTPDVAPSWAAAKVREVSGMRNMRLRIQHAVGALNDEDLAGAHKQFEGLTMPRGHTREPLNVFDQSHLGDEFEVTKMEVPWNTLGRATGGIAPAELWYFAMRLGQGKTWMLNDMQARIAKGGYSVGVASLEMRAPVYAHRVALRMAKNDREVTKALMSEDLGQQKEALDHLSKVIPGKVDIFDPSHGTINSTGFIREICHDYDIVFVDHAGLLMTADGRRAIDDWRAMAVISNVLREITLATTTSIVAAAQINREGERTGSAAPPKASQLSQSDALGQDGDVVVTGKRLSNRTSVFEAVKVRNGPSLRWWTEFDIAKNKIEEISKERALELGVLDADLESSID